MTATHTATGPRPRARRLRSLLTVPALTAVTASLLTALTAAPAVAAVPATPAGLGAAIEPLAPYQPQRWCDPVDKPGVTAFGALLTRTYRGTTVVDVSRSCSSESGTSEHKDGRALDWGVNVANATQKRQAQTLLSWLLATDAHGNKAAMMRRLGIMYVIWNKRIWGSWSQAWEPYSCSGVTACHMDHMHFSFDWSGALQRTSFWTLEVTAPMAPPAYVYRSTSFPQIVAVDSHATSMATPFEVKAGLRYRFTVSGTYRYDGTSTHLADAECSTRGHGWTALAPGDSTASTGGLDLWVNGHRAWWPTPATGGGCNTSSHTYTRTLTFARTASLTLAVHDPTRSGDSGTLSVVVQRIV